MTISYFGIFGLGQWAGAVDKAIYTERQTRLVVLLRRFREASGLRQVDVARRLAMPQSFVSKYESGERRLDLVELEQVCDAIGIGLQELVRAYQLNEKL